MKNSDLDVWAIQYKEEELEASLSNIKNTEDIILYTNCLFHFELGGKIIQSKQFDTFLYSEENDILVMVLRDGVINAQDVRDYLDRKEIIYHEVSFTPSIADYEDCSSIPELWIAREAYVLKDALEDTLKKGQEKRCDYYPALDGKMLFSYLTSSNESHPVEGRIFKGVIQTDDKIILLVQQEDERNLKYQEVTSLLHDFGFQIHVVLEGIPTVLIENRKVK